MSWICRPIGRGRRCASGRGASVGFRDRPAASHARVSCRWRARTSATLFMVVHAALAVLLGAAVGADDIAIGYADRGSW